MQQPDQQQKEQKENQQESELQVANAELRERFLRFLDAMPGRAVEAKMFGGNLPVEGVISAVDAVDFGHLLIDKLRTPMGLIEHAALRTNDAVFFRIPWKLEEGNATANAEEGNEQKVEKECKNEEKEEEKAEEQRTKNVQKVESKRPATAGQIQSMVKMTQQIEPKKFATIFDEVAGAEDFQKAKEEEEKMEMAIEKEEKPAKIMDEEKGKIEEEETRKMEEKMDEEKIESKMDEENMEKIESKMDEENMEKIESKMDEENMEKIESKMDEENMEKMEAEMQMEEEERARPAIDDISNSGIASAANFDLHSFAHSTQIPVSTDVNLVSISHSEPIAASSTTTTSGLSSALTSPHCNAPTPTKIGPIDTGGNGDEENKESSGESANVSQQKKRRNKPTVGSRMGAMGNRVVQMQFASGEEFFDHFDRQQQQRGK